MSNNPAWCTKCDLYYHDCYCDQRDSSDNDDEGFRDEDGKKPYPPMDEDEDKGGFLGAGFPYVPGDPFW